MKFYTKDWYELMQKLDYCVCMRPISDGEYSDDDIKKLYNKRLKAETRAINAITTSRRRL